MDGEYIGDQIVEVCLPSVEKLIQEFRLWTFPQVR